MSASAPQTTPLHAWHAAAGARMTEFGGWLMPLQYAAGPLEEHRRVRGACGLFDISHMGRIRVRGADALDFLQEVQSSDAARVPLHGAQYGLLCAPSGGILDDLFLYRLPDRWLLVVNASNRERDLEWMRPLAAGRDVSLEDVSAVSGMIALQGPAAAAVLARVSGIDASSLPYHTIRDVTVAGIGAHAIVGGYTGEPGFEIVLPAQRLAEAWQAILAAGQADGILPCGLAARDSLRAEACLPLYGHEITERTDPFAAGLGFAVAMDKPRFIGRESLERILRDGGESGPGPAPEGGVEKTLPRRLAAFRMADPGVPRHGCLLQNGAREIGRVTTGLFCPSTGGGGGMGYLEPASARIGSRIGVSIRDALKEARVVRRPLFRSPHLSR